MRVTVTSFRSSDKPVRTRFFVFMGVSGVGKSTIGRAAAEALSGIFIEGDTLHPSDNVRSMTEGRPLNDEQRWPWLKAICETALATAEDTAVTVACSALRVRYRDYIRSMLPQAVFLHLDGPVDIIRERITLRTDHFMTIGMLDSQMAALEPPDNEIRCHSLDIRSSPDTAATQAIAICRQYLDAAEPQGALSGAGN